MRHLTLLPLLGVLLLLAACDPYNAPPEIKLARPETGVFVSGDPLLFNFSEPIDTASLAVRIWPGEKDLEGNLAATATPRLDRCTVATSPCGTTTLAVSEDGLQATLQLDPADLGQPDSPLVVEILPGLKDREGFTRDATARFDIQFAPQTTVGGAEFQDGVYYLVGTTSKPIPTVLRLVTQLIALDDGRVAIAGGEANPIEGAPRNTTNIEEVVIDTSDDGFTIFGTGTLSQDAKGDRFLQSEPFQIEILISGLRVILNDAIMQGKIIKDEDGNDYLDGTLNFSGGTLYIGDNPTPFEGDSAPLAGGFVPPDKVPPGGPDMCGEVCGMIVQCVPPEGFPDPDFCAE